MLQRDPKARPANRETKTMRMKSKMTRTTAKRHDAPQISKPSVPSVTGDMAQLVLAAIAAALMTGILTFPFTMR